MWWDLLVLTMIGTVAAFFAVVAVIEYRDTPDRKSRHRPSGVS